MKRFNWIKSFFGLSKVSKFTDNLPPSLYPHSLWKFSLYKSRHGQNYSSTFVNKHMLTSHHPTHLVKKDQKLKQLEDEIKKLNLGVLRREIFNDCIQITLKYLAWKSSPSQNASAFLAEFQRTSIDFVNHLILYGTNSLSVAPSDKYPYGMEKIKNAVVFVPACLFLYFGLGTIHSSYLELFSGLEAAIEEQAHSIWPIITYISSLIVEVSIIFKNIQDAGKGSSTDQKVGVLKRLRSSFKKKDPLLQVVLYENAITLTSTSIPLLCAAKFKAIDYVYPVPGLSSIGTFLLGCIQVLVGSKLMNQNIQPLIGKGVDTATHEEIVHIIKSHPYVTAAKNVRTVLIGPNKFKLVAEITYELDKLTERVLVSYRDIIDQITYLRDYEDRQETVETALELLPKRFMKEIQIQNNSLEEKIMLKFPNCVHIDIEIDHNQLVNYSDDIERVKSFVNTNFEKHPLSRDVWIDEAINRFLGKDFEQKVRHYKNIVRQQGFGGLYDPLNIYSMEIDHEYIDEWLAVDEEKRFEILKEQLELEKDKNQEFIESKSISKEELENKKQEL